MILRELANSSVYGTIGHIRTKEDVDFLEKHYVTYNLPVLKEFSHVLVATNFDNVEVIPYLEAMWRKYFKDCTFLSSITNRGHGIGTADLDDAIFNFCKDNQVEWLCKSSNDMIFRKEALHKEMGDADFYYFNGILCGKSPSLLIPTISKIKTQFGYVYKGFIMRSVAFNACIV